MQLSPKGLLSLANKVELKPYWPRPFKPVEYLSDQELIAGAGGTLIVDTEDYINFFLIAFKDIKTKKYFKLELPFNVRQLSWIMHNYRTIGFNSLKYDSAMIWCSFAHQNHLKLKDLSDALIFQNLFSLQAQKDFEFKIFPTSHVDLIEVCPLRGSLKLYGARLHAQRIQDLPFNVGKPITEEQKEIITHYCFNDLDTTELQFNNLSEQLKLRQDLTTQYQYDMMSKSDAQIAEAVIGSELKKLTGYWPKKPPIDTEIYYKFNVPNNLYFQTPYIQAILNQISDIQFGVDMDGRLLPSEMNKIRINIGENIYRMGIGGLHSSEENRALKSNDECILIDKDVASYYPAIVLNLGLYPKHLGPNFLKVYNDLRNRRIEAKRNKNIAVSECLKICINGTFGKTGNPYSFLYAPEMTIQITVGGQLYLLMLIEMLELKGIPVASANTDGIVIKCPHSKRQELNELTKMWEQITGFETEETIYDAIYSRDVNAYLAVKKDKDGKIEFKGKNDYYDPWRGKSAKDGYWRFQKNPTAQICVEAIENLISNNISIQRTIQKSKDITKFILVKNVTGGAHKGGEYLGKVVRWYYARDVPDAIYYIKSNNKVQESEGGKPIMDLPTIFPDDIDYERYINRTIDLLYDIAYYKRPMQGRLF